MIRGSGGGDQGIGTRGTRRGLEARAARRLYRAGFGAGKDDAKNQDNPGMECVKRRVLRADTGMAGATGVSDRKGGRKNRGGRLFMRDGGGQAMGAKKQSTNSRCDTGILDITGRGVST